MSSKTALSMSVFVFSVIAVVLTSTVLPIPVWALFSAWATYFFVGSGVSASLTTLKCLLLGVVVATATLLAIESQPEPFVQAVAIGIGSLAMVQLSRLRWFAATPAIVIGFALTVSVVAASGVAISTPNLSNPAAQTILATAVGVAIGVLSEKTAALFHSIAPTRNADVGRENAGVSAREAE